MEFKVKDNMQRSKRVLGPGAWPGPWPGLAWPPVAGHELQRENTGTCIDPCKTTVFYHAWRDPRTPSFTAPGRAPGSCNLRHLKGNPKKDLVGKLNKSPPLFFQGKGEEKEMKEIDNGTATGKGKERNKKKKGNMKGNGKKVNNKETENIFELMEISIKGISRTIKFDI